MRTIKFLAALCCCLPLLGCTGARMFTYAVEPGGFLSQADYEELKKVADQRQLALPKNWKHGPPAPIYVYYLKDKMNYASISTMAIPNLTPMVEGTGAWSNSIPEKVASSLKSKRIAHEVTRTEGPADLVLVGAITGKEVARPGKAVGQLATIGAAHKHLQLEFKVMAHGEQVGAIQVNAEGVASVNPMWLIGDAATGGESGRLSKALVKALERIKKNELSHVSEEFYCPGMLK